MQTGRTGNDKPAKKEKDDHITDAVAVVVTVVVDNHSHGGQAVSKGDKITVTPDERDWLLKHTIIEV